MENLGVLLTYPNEYFEQVLEKRVKLFRLWQSPPSNRIEFLKKNSESIRAIISNAHVGADANTIDALPNLEIISSHSVGLDKIDLAKCRERGIRVTYAPDVLTDEVADTAVGLILATLRKICASDRYVRERKWTEKGNFALTTKVVVQCYLFCQRGTSVTKCHGNDTKKISRLENYADLHDWIQPRFFTISI